MNGLLHRVAARAAGTAVAVRSDARFAYAGGSAGPGDAAEAEAHFPTGAEPLAQMPLASMDHQRGRTMRAVDFADPPAVMNADRTPPAFADARPEAAAMRDAPVTAPNDEVEPRADAAQPRAFDDPRATMPPVPAPSLIPRAALAATDREPETTLAPRETAINVRNVMRADEPSPLMPREARPAPLAAIPQPSTRRGAPQQSGAAQSEADTEVHIHIGRIDVTAVHEAPAPRRRAAAAPAPMSLDGYLAQRGRS